MVSYLILVTRLAKTEVQAAAGEHPVALGTFGHSDSCVRRCPLRPLLLLQTSVDVCSTNGLSSPGHHSYASDFQKDGVTAFSSKILCQYTLPLVKILSNKWQQ